MRVGRLGVLLVAALVGAARAEAPPQPTPRYAPKGKPPGGTSPADAFYLYVTYGQPSGTATSGAGATMVQGNPALAAGDAHTLGELAVQSADLQQIVEIGWTVDALVNDDVHPRLFVFHWVDGQPTCYNGCGWVQVSATRMPGMRVVPGEAAAYAIKLVNGDWWLYYQGEGIGYFPGSLWGGRYTASGYVQWFGEIAAGSAEPCSEMGNGRRGSDPAAASMTELYLVGTDGTELPAQASPGAITNSALYSLGQMTSTSFAFGGPGSPFGCCRPETCLDANAACGAPPDVCGTPLRCGACSLGNVCGEDFQCAPAPIRPDATDPVEDEGGCCGAGRDVRAMIPAFVVAVPLLRRRRRRSL